MTPIKTLLPARNANESNIPTPLMIRPHRARHAANEAFLLIFGVNLPKNMPHNANGIVYARPVKIPKYYESYG